MERIPAETPCKGVPGDRAAVAVPEALLIREDETPQDFILV